VDSEQFERLIQMLTQTESRRRMLAAVLGGGLGLTGVLGHQAAEAGKKKVRAQRKNGGRKTRLRAQSTTEDKKTWICHRTQSDTNQYEYIEVSMNAVDKHINHHGDVFGVDLMTNNQHCGECGTVCGSGLTCTGGRCGCFVGGGEQCPTTGTTVEVPSNGFPGVETGVTVTADQPVVVCASGTWNVGLTHVYGTSFDAEGATTVGTEPCALVPCAPMGALIGSLDAGVTWFAIGTGGTVTGSGELILLANDCPCDVAGGCYRDNEGSITVTIGPA